MIWAVMKYVRIFPQCFIIKFSTIQKVEIILQVNTLIPIHTGVFLKAVKWAIYSFYEVISLKEKKMRVHRHLIMSGNWA